MESNRLLLNELKCLVGDRAWSFTAGCGTGSIVQFDLGKRLRRTHPLISDKLSACERMYVGEYILMLLCPWRIIKGASLICGSGDDNEQDGAMLKGLQMIIDKKITHINIEGSFFDLEIIFEESYRLETFRDASQHEEGPYSIYGKSYIYTLECNGTVSVEPRGAP